MNIMSHVLFFLIALIDAISKLSGSSFKVTTVKSGTKVYGTVYGAFPTSSSNGYKYAGVDTKGNVIVLDDGSYVTNAYANVIYS